MRPQKQERRLLFCGALVPVTLFVASVAWFFSSFLRIFNYDDENAKHRLPFESAAWKSGRYDGDVMWPTRLRMADDLLERKLIEGKTRAQVVTLLGPGDGNSVAKLNYVLGPERGMIRIDSELLTIYFEANGRVSRYKITTD